MLDFGIAAHVVESGGDTFTRSVTIVTADGGVAGTLPYMSPEALRGDPPDARSDVWALGVLLQEMTTGARPFRGETPAMITSAILRDPPEPLSGGTPESFRTIVGRCLARNPDRRYQRAGEIRAGPGGHHGAPARCRNIVTLAAFPIARAFVGRCSSGCCAGNGRDVERTRRS